MPLQPGMGLQLALQQDEAALQGTSSISGPIRSLPPLQKQAAAAGCPPLSAGCRVLPLKAVLILDKVGHRQARGVKLVPVVGCLVQAVHLRPTLHPLVSSCALLKGRSRPSTPCHSTAWLLLQRKWLNI